MPERAQGIKLTQSERQNHVYISNKAHAPKAADQQAFSQADSAEFKFKPEAAPSFTSYTAFQPMSRPEERPLWLIGQT